MQVIAEDWAAVGPQLGGTARLSQKESDRPRIQDAIRPGNLNEPQVREAAYEWLRERTNTFINVLRPRVRSAAADYERRETGTD